MGIILDLTGRKFGRLTVRRLYDCNRHSRWECDCECGKKAIVLGLLLKRGGTRSCGCLRFGITNGKIHGRSRTPEYFAWRSMKQRCSDPAVENYYRYGGRGIRVCEQWNGPESFEAFLSDVGLRPSSSHTLERIDNNGNYEPGNVRWATAKENARNRSDNRLITFRGETLTLVEWSEKTGIKQATLTSRIDQRKWTIKDAFTKTVKRKAV